VHRNFAGKLSRALDEYKPGSHHHDGLDRNLRRHLALAAARRDSGRWCANISRVLREALLAWAEDRTKPEGMPVWQAFQDSAVEALVCLKPRRASFPDGHRAHRQFPGGPPLRARREQAHAQCAAGKPRFVELNLRSRNSALNPSFAATPPRPSAQFDQLSTELAYISIPTQISPW